jgi:hypothetical protein
MCMYTLHCCMLDVADHAGSDSDSDSDSSDSNSSSGSDNSASGDSEAEEIDVSADVTDHVIADTHYGHYGAAASYNDDVNDDVYSTDDQLEDSCNRDDKYSSSSGPESAMLGFTDAAHNDVGANGSGAAAAAAAAAGTAGAAAEQHSSEHSADVMEIEEYAEAAASDTYTDDDDSDAGDILPAFAED